MELFVFARFHSLPGQEEHAAALLRSQAARAREEPGCSTIQVYRSSRDPRLFYIHSRWTDEGSFEVHAELPNTTLFLERMERLIDHPLDVTRARLVG